MGSTKPLFLDLYHAAHLAVLLQRGAEADTDSKSISDPEKKWIQDRLEALRKCRGEDFSCFIKNKKERQAFQEYHRQITPFLDSLSSTQLTELLHQLRPPSRSLLIQQWEKRFQWWMKMEKSLEEFNGPLLNQCKDSKSESCFEISAKIFVKIEVSGETLSVSF